MMGYALCLVFGSVIIGSMLNFSSTFVKNPGKISEESAVPVVAITILATTAVVGCLFKLLHL